MSEKASIFYLLNILQRNLKFVLTGGAIGLALGVLFSVFTPSEYKSHIGFISEKSSSGLPNFGGIPGLSSLNIGSSNDNIDPDLYVNIIQSPLFIRKVTKVTFRSEKFGDISLSEFILTHERQSLFSSILNIPGTIGKSISSFSKKEIEEAERDTISTNNSAIEVSELSEEEMLVLKYIKDNVELSVDKNTELIALTVFHEDRKISADLTYSIFENLKDFLKEMQIEKEKRKYDFISEQFDQSLERFNESQLKLASFRDKNRNVSTALARTQEERLNIEFNIASNVLNTLAVKKEEAKISYEEVIPVFTVIEPAVLANKPIKRPGSLVLVIAFVFLGIAVAYALVFYKIHLQGYFENI
ncbi:MAG: hypothetical protein WD426_18810 [Anditalea sp.]